MSRVEVSTAEVGVARVITARGVLDGTTYLGFRDQIIKAALDEPAGVVVDVNALRVPAPSAWAMFTSARWHVSIWPDVPVMLACGDAAVRATIAHNGVARYVPVYPTTDAAVRAACSSDGHRGRRRARADLPAKITSAHRARELVAEWLTGWSKTELIGTAKVVVDVLVENVLEHTDSTPVLVVESDGDTVTVTVRDGNSRPAVRHEDVDRSGGRVSGLAVVAALCCAWGSTPTPSGKTVWAVIGPESRL